MRGKIGMSGQKTKKNEQKIKKERMKEEKKKNQASKQWREGNDVETTKQFQRNQMKGKGETTDENNVRGEAKKQKG